MNELILIRLIFSVASRLCITHVHELEQIFKAAVGREKTPCQAAYVSIWGSWGLISQDSKGENLMRKKEIATEEKLKAKLLYRYKINAGELFSFPSKPSVGQGLQVQKNKKTGN